MHYQQRSAAAPDGTPDLFVMSDGSVDRTGDVVEPGGWQLDRLKSDPVVLFNHDRNQILGRWADIAVKGGRLMGRIVWPQPGTPAGDAPLVQYVRSLVEQGILRTVSVGFRPLAKQPIDDKADKMFGPFRYTKSELLECSLVSVPANPHALAIAKNFPRDVIAEVFRKPADYGLGAELALHGKPAKPSPRREFRK